jgi:hypothetical protein
MSRRSLFASVAACLLAVLLAGCASLSNRDPLVVTVAGIESLPGEGMEMRLLVKLRVQNPNDLPIDYDGIALNFDVQGRSFASGVSAEAGSVPRFGEVVVAVPVTVSVLRMVRQVVGMMDGKPVDRIEYELRGKLNSASLFGMRRFSAKGDFRMPAETPDTAL